MAEQLVRGNSPRIEINDTEYTYSYSNSKLLAYGYAFSRDLPYNEAKPLNFWKAQLAFRGYSARGSDVTALKERLRYADMTEMDPRIKAKLLNADMTEMDPEIKEKLRNHLREASRKRKASSSQIDAGRRPAPSAPPRRQPSPVRPSHPILPRQRIVDKRLAGQSEEDKEDEDERDEHSEDEEEEKEDNEEWDINGTWKIKCPDMAECFGQFRPYTLKIFTSQSAKGDLRPVRPGRIYRRLPLLQHQPRSTQTAERPSMQTRGNSISMLIRAHQRKNRHGITDGGGRKPERM